MPMSGSRDMSSPSTTPTAAPSLRIALVDDHEVFRQGLRALLEKHSHHVVWEAECARDAIEAAAREEADVVLMDLSMPGNSGIEATREILRHNPEARLLILTMHGGEEHVVQAFLAGATGFALKTQKFEEILEAIRATFAGKLYLAPTIPRRSLDEYNRRIRSHASGLDALSPRERQVFELVVQNQSNRQIAQALKISVKTVETHRLAVNKKLGMHSAAELVRFAALSGLLHR